MRLSAFQDAFVEALYDPQASCLPILTEQPGFTVYRNTVMRAAVGALHANFPTVERLVGKDWFAAAAALHARQSTPLDARLIYHGAGFPAFLDQFEHAQSLPYLGDVARLDLLWTQCHTAMDEAGIDVPRIASLAPEQLASLRLTPKASARWAWFAHQPVFSIWRHNREGLQMPEHLCWQGEGALLVRSGGAVDWHALDIGDCAFLDACAAGKPLAQAAVHASDAQASLDIFKLLTRLISARVFVATDPS
ncbi:DNA-binding domain-containing protein [Pseudomonas sp. LP_7_YM]|uniref:HvfC/BufC N-terminal domain-containing protein n=1 Tax=Pseudomonas sp. LP_7_YM TaxID=2485137 RepID=UPI00105CF89F|nr:DNA-binding domain-containing protein [Pseudomonas sp. LP_7_YM]TDV72437.1 putative DNA-binding protein [Pseudomonas sp. LP_7_YM]